MPPRGPPEIPHVSHAPREPSERWATLPDSAHPIDSIYTSICCWVDEAPRFSFSRSCSSCNEGSSASPLPPRTPPLSASPGFPPLLRIAAAAALVKPVPVRVGGSRPTLRSRDPVASDRTSPWSLPKVRPPPLKKIF